MRKTSVMENLEFSFKHEEIHSPIIKRKPLLRFSPDTFKPGFQGFVIVLFLLFFFLTPLKTNTNVRNNLGKWFPRSRSHHWGHCHSALNYNPLVPLWLLSFKICTWFYLTEFCPFQFFSFPCILQSCNFWVMVLIEGFGHAQKPADRIL